MPVASAQKVLADAQQKPVLLERISLLNADISLLQQRIAEKEAIIKEYLSKDGNNAAIIQALQDEKAKRHNEKLIWDEIRRYRAN